MITFDRHKGTIFHADGSMLASGVWSGHGDAHNDPTREREKMIGPLPAGLYRMSPPRDGGHLGPYVIDLVMIEGNSFDRSLFRIHGNNATPEPWDASDGCIIAPLLIRQKCWAETDHLIRVV